MKKGQRVFVEYEDITADLHSEKDLDCVVAQVCGCDYKDRMTVPAGCVITKEKI